MAHEIEGNNVVWATTPCWHGLGTEMDPKASGIEWMKAANLDWAIHRLPMFVTLPNGEHANVLGQKGTEHGVLVRDHGTNTFAPEDVFGPVGPDWVPVQNEDVFKFMDRFCKAGNMQMETAGSLKGGTEIWALAKFRDDFDIVPGDTMKGYLLFHSAHVQGKGNQLRLTPVRVVCNNTLTMALGDKNKKSAFRMPHVRAFDTDVQNAAVEALGLANEQMDTFRETVTLLAKKKADDKLVKEMITQIYQPNLMGDRAKAKATNDIMEDFTPSSDTVYEAIAKAPGGDLKGSKGTWWGAFNGVTYFEDHMRLSYSDQSNILQSTWLGGGSRRKERAMALATEYARAA
jgi:phage/plasmid-like protein (TIGR03299 family)